MRKRMMLGAAFVLPILIERMDHAALLAGVELAPGKALTKEHDAQIARAGLAALSY
jgi:uncharacterized protein GlcG (DUF336 family)